MCTVLDQITSIRPALFTKKNIVQNGEIKRRYEVDDYKDLPR